MLSFLCPSTEYIYDGAGTSAVADDSYQEPDGPGGGSGGQEQQSGSGQVHLRDIPALKARVVNLDPVGSASGLWIRICIHFRSGSGSRREKFKNYNRKNAWKLVIIVILFNFFK